MEEAKFYNVERVAEILDVSIRTVRRLISDGVLKAIKVRKSIRISDDSLNTYIRMETINSQEHPKKKRFSLRGRVKGGGPISEEAIDEVIKEWNTVKELQ
jgi:excisionase family DNA binding protein